jgi:glycosyltransferase involved in cell wall biosynthesis
MKLSIIIPVYKVEKYIQSCLESIFLNQTVQLLCQTEVIVVDDGTPDDSMRVVDAFAAKYKNLVVIHQSNQGLSAARNAGLRMAQGDYIWFVDSDDRIEENCLQGIFEDVARYQAEMMGYNVCSVNEATHEETLLSPSWKSQIDHDVCFDGQKATKMLHTGLVQRFIFNRDFLTKNQFCFQEGIIYEDIELMPRVICALKRGVLLKRVTYRYLVRQSGSIMSSGINEKSLRSNSRILDNYEVLASSFPKGSWQYGFLNLCCFDRIKWEINILLKNRQALQADPGRLKSLKKELVTHYFKASRYITIGKTYHLIDKLFKTI